MLNLTANMPTTKRKYGKTVAKARYGSTSPQAQQRLILSNAKAIRGMQRMQQPSVYCDWQLGGEFNATGNVEGNFTQSVLAQDLMQTAAWISVMRKDTNVTASSSTLVKRLQLNMRMDLNGANYAQFSIFVVSLRQNAASLIPSSASLTKGVDYIDSTQDFNVRLNAANFKIHYQKYVSLTSGGWLQPQTIAGGETFFGNPETTFAKCQADMAPDVDLRNPTNTQWRQLTSFQLKPEDRRYLLVFITQQTPANPEPDVPSLSYDLLCTTINRP